MEKTKERRDKPAINKAKGRGKHSPGSKNTEEISSTNRLLVIIRISGMVHVRKDIAETLNRMRLRRKYACVVIKPTKEILGMLKKVKHYVTFGEIKKETLARLLKERAKSIKGNKKEIKINAEEIAEKLDSGKKLEELGIKPFFRLHPPRKGIVSKRQCTRGGVLGLNKEINELVERML